MVINYLILTGALALTNCQSTSEATKLAAYKEKAVELLEDSKDVYFTENYNLNYYSWDSIVKQKILNYNKDNLSSNVVDTIKDSIISDENYYNIENISNIEFFNCSNDMINKYNKDNLCFENYSKEYITTETINDKSESFPVKNSKYINSRFYKYENPYGTSETIEFPTRTLNESNSFLSTNNNLNSLLFIGIKCSKDFCIEVYNLIASYANDQARDTASNTPSIWKTIYELIITLNNLSIINFSSLLTIIETITIYFSSIYTTLVLAIFSHDLISVLIGVALIILGCAIITFITILFVFGYLEKGFVIGWQIYSDFSSKWIHEVLC